MSHLTDDRPALSTTAKGTGTTTETATFAEPMGGSVTTRSGQHTTTRANENAVDAEVLFGTTTVAAGESTSTLTTGRVTLPPAEPTKADGVLLPQTGYDPDGRGRIQVGQVSVSGRKFSLQLKNISTSWMTEESSYLEYTCYGKDGRELQRKNWHFGAIRAGKSHTCEAEMPEGTAEIKITAFKTVYWTEWK